MFFKDEKYDSMDGKNNMVSYGSIILKLVITRILKFLWIKCNFSNVSINSGNGGILVGSDISHIKIAPHWLLNYSTCLYE